MLDHRLPCEIVGLAHARYGDGLALHIIDALDVVVGEDAEDRLIQEAGDHDDVLAGCLRADDRRASHAGDVQVAGDERGNRGGAAVHVLQVEVDAVVVEVAGVLGQRPDHLVGRFGHPASADHHWRRGRLGSHGGRRGRHAGRRRDGRFGRGRDRCAGRCSPRCAAQRSRQSELLDRYLEALDPQHLHFIQADLEEFAHYRTNLDHLTKGRNMADTHPACEIFQRFVLRLQERVAYAEELLKTEKFTFDSDERIAINRHELSYPKDLTEQMLEYSGAGRRRE